MHGAQTTENKNSCKGIRQSAYLGERKGTRQSSRKPICSTKYIDKYRLREQAAETYATQEYHLEKGGPQHGRQVPAISQASSLSEDSDQSINVQTHMGRRV